ATSAGRFCPPPSISSAAMAGNTSYPSSVSPRSSTTGCGGNEERRFVRGRLRTKEHEASQPVQLVRLDQRSDRAGEVRPQVRAPDHRPGADPEFIQTCRDKSCDAPLSPLPIFHLVASRVP